jgi:hypothetical protein
MKKSTLLLAGGALMIAAAFNSCKKSSSSLPPIGGYNTSNDIEATNLLAHWTFENSLNEVISATAPTSTVSGITYTTGVGGLGKAAQFSNGYAVYPSIAALSSSDALFANGFTVSAWVKVANNGSTISPIFTLASPVDSQTDWNHGPIEMFVETGQHAVGNDTITLHTDFGSYVNGSWLGNDNINAGGAASDTTFQWLVAADTTWIHYVTIYDPSTSFIQIYANNVLVSNKQYQHRTVSSGAGLGAINILTPTEVVLGSLANSTVGFTKDAVQTWQGNLTGTVDNIRVYSKPLSVSEISALYNLELAGR